MSFINIILVNDICYLVQYMINQIYIYTYIYGIMIKVWDQNSMIVFGSVKWIFYYNPLCMIIIYFVDSISVIIVFHVCVYIYILIGFFLIHCSLYLVLWMWGNLRDFWWCTRRMLISLNGKKLENILGKRQINILGKYEFPKIVLQGRPHFGRILSQCVGLGRICLLPGFPKTTIFATWHKLTTVS